MLGKEDVMPIIYLSPSTQEANLFVNGGSEEYYMNLIADAMVPYLQSSGIEYVRNTPDMTAASSIAASNRGFYNFHLALHSNAASGDNAGKVRGAIAFYYGKSENGRKMANIIVKNLKLIYPLPDRVRAETTISIGEVVKTKAPAVLVELAFHDNIEDATWLKEHIHEIAVILVQSLCEYFNIPFNQPMEARQGVVHLESGRLNIRSKPDTTSHILGYAYNNDVLTVLGQYENFYVVLFQGIQGYASANYIAIA